MAGAEEGATKRQGRGRVVCVCTMYRDARTAAIVMYGIPTSLAIALHFCIILWCDLSG